MHEATISRLAFGSLHLVPAAAGWPQPSSPSQFVSPAVGGSKILTEILVMHDALVTYNSKVVERANPREYQQLKTY